MAYDTNKHVKVSSVILCLIRYIAHTSSGNTRPFYKGCTDGLSGKTLPLH